MNQPHPFTLLAGNWIGFLVAFALGTLLVYLSFINPREVPFYLPFLGVMICCAAIKARREYAIHKSLQRQWDKVSGEGAKKAARRKKRRRIAFIAGSIFLWVWALWWLVVYAPFGNTRAYGVVATVFLVLTAWGLGIAARRVWKLGRRVWWWYRARRERNRVVGVALSTPGSSRGLKQIASALPGYCRKLLERRKGTPDSTTSADAEST